MRTFDEDGTPVGTDDEVWFDEFRRSVDEIAGKLLDCGCLLSQEEIVKFAMWQVAGDAVAKGDHLLLDSFNMTVVALSRAFANDPEWVRIMQQTRGRRGGSEK